MDVCCVVRCRRSVTLYLLSSWMCVVWRQAPNNKVRYSLIEDNLAKQYFMVDEVTGEVSVKKDLATNSNRQYTVRHRHLSATLS